MSALFASAISGALAWGSWTSIWELHRAGALVGGLRSGCASRHFLARRATPGSAHEPSQHDASASGGCDGDEPEASVEASGSQPLRYSNRPKWRKRFRRFLPFDEARRCAQALGFESKEDWDDWVSEGKKSPFLGPYMPSDPEAMYAEEWQGWDDFLGVILKFDEARDVVRVLGLQNQEEWFRFAEQDPVRLRALRLPVKPRVYYRDQWKGYDHWLGLPETTLYVPKEWHDLDLDG